MLTEEIPQYIRTLIPHLPAKPIEETQRQYGLKKMIQLASNENSLGPSPMALTAIKSALTELHRYPDPGSYHLKSALASRLGRSASEFFVGHGVHEIIDLVVRAFCVPGDQMVTSQAAFSVYRFCAQVHGVSAVEAPMTHDLRFDLGAIFDAIRRHPRVKIVFIANPNNPTGTAVTDHELRSFLRELAAFKGDRILVVLDYAYLEYLMPEGVSDPAAWLSEFPFVVLMRTFSKIYGLAGLRVGYALADARVVEILEKIRQPFNMSHLAQVAATAALKDTGFVNRSRKMNFSALKAWESGLDRLGIPYWKSHGNFILADVETGMGPPGTEIYEAALRRGVMFRSVANYGLPGALRISMGTPEENAAGIAVLSEIMDVLRRGKSIHDLPVRSAQGTRTRIRGRKKR